MKDSSFTSENSQLKNHMRGGWGESCWPVKTAGFLFTLSDLEELQVSEEARTLETINMGEGN